MPRGTPRSLEGKTAAWGARRTFPLRLHLHPAAAEVLQIGVFWLAAGWFGGTGARWWLPRAVRCRFSALLVRGREEESVDDQ